MAREPYLGPLSDEQLASLGSMEGWSEPVVEAAGRTAVKARPSPWPGYLLALAVAALAFALHSRLISGAILAILLGLAVRNLFSIPPAMVDAAKTMVKRLIPVTIVLTGAGLNLGAIAGVGLPGI